MSLAAWVTAFVPVGSDGVPVNCGESKGAFNTSPGTVGASAVPPKSPVNWSFPFTVAVASGVAAAVIADCTKAVLAIWLVLVPLAAVGTVGIPVSAGEANGALVSKAVWVAVEIGLFASLVLSTLLRPKFVLAPETEEAPVPPLAIATIPDTFSAVLDAYANGTAEKFWLLTSIKIEQLPVISISTCNFFVVLFQKIALKLLAYPPTWSPWPTTKFTIPNSSVFTFWVSWYSKLEVASLMLNRRQISLFAKRVFWLLLPGNISPTGS